MNTISRRRVGLATLAVLAAMLAPAISPAARPGAIYGYIPMEDGVTLKYQVLLPDPDVWGDGPYQMVMDYSGYVPAQSIYDGLHHRFRESGYAVVGLNIRGTHCSGGYFDYFEPLQARDGARAIEYLTGHLEIEGYERPGMLGDKLAMVGKSYPGITQLFVAAERPRGLASIVPGHVFGDLYRDVPFPGGILNATFAGYWSASRAAETMYSGPAWWQANQDDDQCIENWPEHAPNTPYNPFVQATYNQYDGPLFWERSPWWWADQIDVPTFLVEAWQDEQVGSRATHLIERFRPGLPWKFLAANGDHGEYYGEQVLPHIYRFLEFTLRGEEFVPGDFGEAYDFNPDDERNGWIGSAGFPDATAAEYWAEDPVTINFENGANGGRRAAFAQTFSAWPPAETVATRLYLTTDGTLSADPPGSTAPDPDAGPLERLPATEARLAGAVDYLYAPYAGTQERGDAELADGVGGDWQRKPPEGSYAMFTSEAFEQDTMLLGTASADLWITSTAPDTDLEVALTEVRSDGQEVFVQKGWLRASHRMEDTRFSTELRPFQTHRLADVAPLVAGHPTLARVEIFPFGHAYRAGSKLRIWVNAPNIVPDLWGFAALPIPALNTIYTSAYHPSSIALPVIEGATVPTGYPTCGSLRKQPCRPEG